MKLSEYLDDQIQSANVIGTPAAIGNTAGTLRPDGSYAKPSMFKQKKNMRFKKKKKQNVVNGIMQARPLPKEKP